ncbi:hypothetical protein P175DRAFT_0505630 [Aspergillus ochraceoroseus IBT 24754]|uniref:PWWP domain-containing protein n=1 Tax=Aspergillus ochraceoroseus IBT 24754 TaxID=1392256 RepID=A0A2T5M5P0_9EURO|nr:uncharacterized protein P175DRAFT_0505630 [Aspergillus ochraceoroseus IBT 24754]PTU23844.1 hypothetical protein P175DRAFT_0505630 [Aspergillus ochraceoroseus IBT 24754]
MAEATATPLASAPDAGESAERVPAEVKAGPVESESIKAKAEQNTNGAEDESADAPEEKKESSKASAEKSSPESDAKKPEDSAAAPAESEPVTGAEPNGTPSSAKKSGSSKRKSMGGDNKSKLNRKKSMSRITHLDAKPGEYYLARLRSFPPWPAIVCDEEILPQSLLSTRPVTAQRPDGTYRDDYADGGKRAAERTFPVMFLETNEFAWIPNTDLNPLDPTSCKEVSEKGKSKLLIAAYGVAAEAHDLPYFKDLLADHQRAIQQEEEEREAQAAAKAAAKAEKEAKKNKRKSMEIVDDVDMEDADEDNKKPKSSKKRKAEAEGEEKPAKTPKTGTKLKLTTPKTPASETKKSSGGSKAKQSASKKSAKAASDESGDSRSVSKEPEKQINPEEAQKKKEREVLFVRHRLQKGFISRDQPPKEEEMQTMSGFLTKLENIEDLEVSIIRSTKIHKVLRMIIKLPSIPRDEEFQFRKRALDILSKWKNVLDSDIVTPAAEDKDKEDKPKANGVHKEGSAEKEEESKPEPAEPQDEPMADVDSAEKTDEPSKSETEKVAAPETSEPSAAKASEKSEEKTAEAAA